MLRVRRAVIGLERRRRDSSCGGVFLKTGCCGLLLYAPGLRRLTGGEINWNLSGRQNMSFRTSAHTGVGISIEFQAAHRHTVCSNLPFPGIHSVKRQIPNLPYHRTIPSGSGWERLQTTPVTTWPPALRANSNLSFRCVKPISTFIIMPPFIWAPRRFLSHISYLTSHI